MTMETQRADTTDPNPAHDGSRGQTAIVGAGRTGMSFARYLSNRGRPYILLDQAPTEGQRAELREISGSRLLEFNRSRLLTAREIMLSPGVPRAGADIQAALASGIPVRGDLDVFAGDCGHSASVMAITGTNGKSTVTTLLGQMAEDADMSMKVGGNLGIPCLDLLDESAKGYILEISSYQLESAGAFRSDVATVLNLAPDHLDRYDNLEHYYETKASLYRRTNIAVVNKETDYPFDLSGCEEIFSFGREKPNDTREFGLVGDALYQGERQLIDTGELKIRGLHNLMNILAALAMGAALRWDMESMLQSVRNFPGLAHRCETVAAKQGCVFVNDSKATNPAATEAAVLGMSHQAKNLCLLAGGISKDADMKPMARSTAPYLAQVIAFGRDSNVIEEAFRNEGVVVSQVADLGRAVAEVSSECDMVLLSPGCASFDQFRNFEHRGDVFKTLILGDTEIQDGL